MLDTQACNSKKKKHLLCYLPFHSLIRAAEIAIQYKCHLPKCVVPRLRKVRARANQVGFSSVALGATPPLVVPEECESVTKHLEEERGETEGLLLKSYLTECPGTSCY